MLKDTLYVDVSHTEPHWTVTQVPPPQCASFQSPQWHRRWWPVCRAPACTLTAMLLVIQKHSLCVTEHSQQKPQRWAARYEQNQ